MNLLVAVMLAPVVVLTACGTPKPGNLACTTDLVAAENTYLTVADGLRDRSLSRRDAAAALKRVEDELQVLSVVNPRRQIKRTAREASRQAGWLRAVFADNRPVSGPGILTFLRNDLNQLDAACVAAAEPH